MCLFWDSVSWTLLVIVVAISWFVDCYCRQYGYHKMITIKCSNIIENTDLIQGTTVYFSSSILLVLCISVVQNHCMATSVMYAVPLQVGNLVWYCFKLNQILLSLASSSYKNVLSSWMKLSISPRDFCNICLMLNENSHIVNCPKAMIFDISIHVTSSVQITKLHIAHYKIAMLMK